MSSSPRILSLLPGATELVCALSLREFLVGRSHECDYPPSVQSLPPCTRARLSSQQPSGAIDREVRTLVEQALSIYNLELEAISQLQPTHILTQDQCDVCAVSLPQVEAAIGELSGFTPQVISLQPDRLADLWSDIERVAEVFAIAPQPLLAKLQGRVKHCQEKTAALPLERRPTVAAIEWIDPLMGAGNWIPELVELAGGKCLFGNTGQHSPYLSWEELSAAAPDAIVIMPCGFDRDRTRQEAQILTENPQWSSLTAVQQQQVYLTDGNAYFNRPGPRLVDSLEILAEILHPDLFEFGYPETAWCRWEIGT